MDISEDVRVLDELDSLDSGAGAGPAGRTGMQWQNTAYFWAMLLECCSIRAREPLISKCPR
jgi:hypothetical protein